MRILSEDEIKLVAGAYNGSEQTVTVWHDRYFSDWFDAMNYWSTLGPPDTGGSGGGGEDPPPQEPDCNLVNPVGLLNPPDGARYYLPENVTENYLMAALNHLSNYSRTHTGFQTILEFKAMYEDPNHPHYIDFKDWGTPAGPPGSVGGGTITYYSEALGREVTASAFEPFGNWFYGFAGAWAGISTPVLFGGAAVMQEGSTNWVPRDGLEDQPHVLAGINAAKAYGENQQLVFQILKGSCTSGGATLVSFGNPDWLDPLGHISEPMYYPPA